jgi:hypothetical protein
MEATTYDALEDTAKEGLGVLREVLKERNTEEPMLVLARIAATSVSAFTRVYQANSAREATLVTMMSQAAGGTEEFRRLVQAALPASPVAKALREGNQAQPS